jgi:hypothetical protein
MRRRTISYVLREGFFLVMNVLLRVRVFDDEQRGERERKKVKVKILLFPCHVMLR